MIPLPLTQLLEHFSQISDASNHVPVCHGCFLQLSSFFKRISSVLKEVQEGSRMGSAPLQTIIPLLEAEIKNAGQLISICTRKSRFYLLLNGPSYAKCIQTILGSLGQALLRISSSSDGMEISPKLKNKIKLLCNDLQSAQIRVSAAEEDLMDEIELNARNQQADNKYSNELLLKIATLAGVSSDPSSLRHEYNELRKERENLELDKQETEAVRIGRILSLLRFADALSIIIEREKHYQDQRSWLNGHILPPLQTFYCPITQDVMEEPVEIESGYTFEMSAIQKWFQEGHSVCPVTKRELQSLSMKPNRLLKQSIEEWKERNAMMKVTAVASRLKSVDEKEILEALLEIQDMCEERPVAKYWVTAEGLIPVLVGLLKSNKRDLRRKTLITLNSLVADHSENKQKVCDAGAIECIVHSLARDAGESRQAVALLLELAKEERLCHQIAKAQGCILLLVTIANSENPHSAADGMQLLELFSKSDINVIFMAEVNYFKPLIQSLEKGSLETQVLMANKLSEMQLSNQSRTFLVQEGVLAPLVKMISSGNVECKVAALGALLNLSVLEQNRDAMIKAGVMEPLLDILFTVKSIGSTMREHAAAIFANLSMASQPMNIKDLWGNQRDIDETTLKLISLINITGTSIQGHILKALSYICSHTTSVSLRETLRGSGSIQLLMNFMDSEDTKVRLYTLKLLYFLTKDGGADTLAEEMKPHFYSTIVNIFSSELLEEEKTAAMGILGNLPLYNKQVTDRMLEKGVLTSIVSILDAFVSRRQGASSVPLVENAMWTLVRFTLSTDIQLQEYTAKQDIVPLLVNLLKSGTTLIKSRAAMSLQQLSENTRNLSKPMKKSGSWCCFSADPRQSGCILHGGVCSIHETFCLLEAGALPPLIKALDDKEDEKDEAVLSALLTLVSDEFWEKGSDFIVQYGGVKPIIRKLNSESVEVQEKALLILEKIFRKEEYRKEFGSMAQMLLVSLTQDGANLIRPLAARILSHLNILHPQSTYF